MLMTAGCFSHAAFAFQLLINTARSGDFCDMSHRVDGLLLTVYSAKDAAVCAAYPAASFLADADDAAMGGVRFR
jgi:hypothetical protein